MTVRSHSLQPKSSSFGKTASGLYGNVAGAHEGRAKMFGAFRVLLGRGFHPQ
ncbi:hypothetical protein ABZY36_07265 [Streptomyces sp. NPDC006627]|uniref:hypothetical protein n=1 Tax=Streptomyces sp. NPDC006627 TaxID=3154679 RepID=UPI0033A0AA88